MKQNKSAEHFIQLPTFDGLVPAELSADYILPDTYPDVKKILRVMARPAIIGRYISGRRLEYSGAVDYSILFSADGENGDSLHCVHFAGEWENSLGELDSLDSANISLTPHISSCSARLSNPRKISIRSTVMTDVKVAANMSCTPKCEGARTLEEELRLERLLETVTAKRERTFVAEPLRISENLEPDASQPAIDEVVACNVNIHFYEAKPLREESGFTVSLKGEAIADCIYKSQTEAGDYRSFSRKLPISYIVGADDYTEFFSSCPAETLSAYAAAVPIEINAVASENSYGERRVLELDFASDVTVHIIGGEEVPLTLDAYSIERESECITSELDCEAPSKILWANFSIGEAVPREELKIPENASVIDAAAEVTANALALERGRAVLAGNAAISCILTDANGNISVTDVMLPIRCELNAGEIKEPFAYNCTLSASDMRVRFDPERICFDFEVSLCAEMYEKSRRSVVDTIRLTGDAPSKHNNASLMLCYPAKDESMWQVAKRYGTTVSALEAANTAGSRVLLIPSAMPHGFVMEAL